MTRRLHVALAALVLVGCDGSSPTDAGLDSGAADAATMEDAATPPGDAGPPSGDTWASFAEAFFATYCTECHDATPRDYRTIDGVRTDAATIACGVTATARAGCGSFPPPRQFPIGTGPRPTDDERARLVAWIDAGMPE